MIELNQRVDLLRKIHLFAGLKLDQLSGVAAIFEEREVPNGQIVFKQGDKPDGFYILFKGRVKVTRPGKKGRGGRYPCPAYCGRLFWRRSPV